MVVVEATKGLVRFPRDLYAPQKWSALSEEEHYRSLFLPEIEGNPMAMMMGCRIHSPYGTRKLKF